MKEFDSLTSLTPERILHIVHTAQNLPHHTWTELVPGDEVLNVGQILTSPNEKYFRLLAKQPLDDCQRRTALRNLQRFDQGISAQGELAEAFVGNLAPPPEFLLRQFRESCS
jgi:hypothetical protein